MLDPFAYGNFAMLSGTESVGTVCRYGLDARYWSRKDAEGCAAI